jgi:hypothetical protein
MLRHYALQIFMKISMRFIIVSAGLIVVCAGIGRAQAANCDFDKPVSRCTGSIEMKRTYGSKKSYGAEIVVHSSAAQCSKVEYYVDSTPYQTVFSHNQAEPESLFGTKPISRKNITVDKCTTYASTGAASQPGSIRTAAGSGLSGHWSGTIRWTFVSDGAEVDVNVQGNRATGSWKDGKTGIVKPFQGTVSGNTLTFAITVNDGSQTTGTLAMTAPNTARFVLANSAATFSGTLTRN